MRSISITLLLVTVIFWTGCKKRAAAGPGGGGGGGFAMQVVAVPAREQPVRESISLVGNIAPNEMVELKSETDGIVKEIHFDEGQRVKAGDLLVVLDDTKLAAQLAEAEANLQLARTSFERVAQLFRDKLISQQEHDQAAASFASNEASVGLKRRELSDARVTAPFNGITGARPISPGQVISRSTTLTWLVDLDTVNVEVNVPERYLGQLALGKAVEFKVAAYPQTTFKGEVFFISPQLDAGTRTALVKARIANPGAQLKGGMFASLDLSLQLRESALVIPETAVVNNGDVTMVFAVTAANTVVMKPVQLGLRLAGKVEVLGGLAPGEQVVVEGIQKLRPGAPVKLAGPEAAAPYLN